MFGRHRGYRDRFMDTGEVSWRRPPLVASAWELRCFGRTWAVVAVVAAAGVVISGGVDDLSAIEVWACALLFFLTVAGALARAFLGLRTQPDMEYARVFDRSPAPPAGLRLETGRSTASRAAWAATGIAGLLVVGAAALLVVMFILMGTPREHVLDHLAGAAVLLAGGVDAGVRPGVVSPRRMVSPLGGAPGTDRPVLAADVRPAGLRVLRGRGVARGLNGGHRGCSAGGGGVGCATRHEKVLLYEGFLVPR